MSLLDLPDELLARILEGVTLNGLLNICLLSREGHRLCKDEFLWKYFTQSYYGVNKLLKKKNWYETFKYLYENISPEQAEWLHYLKNSDPETWKELLEMAKHETYYLDMTNEKRNFDHVLIQMFVSPKGFSRDFIFILTKDTTAKNSYFSISLGDDQVIHVSHSVDLHDETMKKLTKEGIKITEVPDKHREVLIYITREQMKHLLPLL